MRGELQEAILLSQLTRSQIKFLLPSLEPEFEMQIYKLCYKTVDLQGEPTIASAALYCPSDSRRSYPLVSYHHGTVFARHEVASHYGYDLIGLRLSSSGYITLLPDYLGYGESSIAHPYSHAASLATTIVDALRAAKGFCARHDWSLKNQVFLAGFSEGGLATLAAQRLIEHKHRDEIALTASAPIAGVYDPLQTACDILARDVYEQPALMTYLIFSYSQIYGWRRLDHFFQRHYVECLPTLHDGKHSGAAIHAALSPVIRELYQAKFLADFFEDGEHDFKNALEQNEVYRWCPQAPICLFHSEGDPISPYCNSLTALESFRKRGAQEVELCPVTASTHEGSRDLSIGLVLEWFDAFH